MTTATPSENRMPGPGLNPWKPRILHVAYFVKDIDRALAFYVGVLGMKEQMRIDLSATVHEVVLGFPDGKSSGVILMWDTARASAPALGDGYSRIVLHVHDLDAALAHLRANDTQVTKEPTKVGSMRYAMVADPDGYVIELLKIER